MVRTFLDSMIERKQGHIVGISSVAGLVGFPEAKLYTATKFAVRGFMETLSMEMYLRGQSDYIKTTCVFPYFVETSSDIKDATHVHLKFKSILKMDESAEQIVDGILRNEEIITLPRAWYYFTYLW